ncbi:MAG: hypothetical protein M1818_002612 [Claussenomyces sp. TS43310]|nr:MAG: hypothetical protein M1818_002612 [Claussenomyces sp. TS43310]
MVLELHVWGPGFSLPSIEAQCLAAIAYLSQAVPRGEWELVASSDPALSPTGELPALRNENIWIGGFRNILDYITKLSGGAWSLDADLEGIAKADCVAFCSFVESRGRDLLDLSLYVSTANYTSVTRPIYSKIQSFPLTYFTPPALRSASKARTAPLGLSSLDIDSPEDDKARQEKLIIPDSLRRPRQTVSSLLSASPENQAQIRLDALACAFLEPLQALRGKKRFFINQSPTSLDCLALGHLALALLPDLPSPWLANCMRRKFPQLCAFVHDSQRTFFGGAVSLEDAALTTSSERDIRAQGKGSLPWKAPDRGGLLAVASAFSSNLADSIPVISRFRKNTRLEQELEQSAEDEEELNATRAVAAMKQRELYTTIGSAIVGIGLFVAFMFQQGLITISEASLGQDEEPTEELNGLNQYGEAGAALAMLAQQMDFEMEMEKTRERDPEKPVVELDVEVVGDGEHVVHT